MQIKKLEKQVGSYVLKYNHLRNDSIYELLNLIFPDDKTVQTFKREFNLEKNPATVMIASYVHDENVFDLVVYVNENIPMIGIQFTREGYLYTRQLRSLAAFFLHPDETPVQEFIVQLNDHVSKIKGVTN